VDFSLILLQYIVMDNNCSLDELKTRVDKLVDSLYNNRVEQIEDLNYETF
jgi:hypothetical protein